MDSESTEDSTKLSRRRRDELHELRTKMHHYLKDKEQYSRCEITVRRRGDWYEFHGHVGSSATKSVLFGMVPTHNGAQRIVDHVRVGGLPS